MRIWTNTMPHLCFPCALKDVHQSKSHLLFAFHTQQRLQNCAQCSVVVGNVFRKFLVQLHREDVHSLVARLDAKWGVDDFGTPNTATFGQNTGLYHRVPLLNKLPPSDAGDGDADKAKVCAFFLRWQLKHRATIFWYFDFFHFVTGTYLASLFVCFFVEVQTKATDGRQIVKFKMLAPEHGVCPGFAGGAGVQHVIQTQLAIVTFLRWEVSCLNDPQLEHIIHPPAVILEVQRGALWIITALIYISLHFMRLLPCIQVVEWWWWVMCRNVTLLEIYCVYLIGFDGSLKILNPFVSFWGWTAGETFCSRISGHLERRFNCYV